MRHPNFARSVLFVAIGLSLQVQAATPADTAVETNYAKIEEMLIVGLRENRVSKGATGLALDIKETPQSISVVTSEQMSNFGATNINDALRMATGLSVEQWETNRTNYLSRGFEIKSTQIDGVGMPNDWGIVTGAIDAFGYEKIEVIRGANGLLTGVGNSAGTLNYVRKRPTNDARGSVTAIAGSDDLTRLEVDYSTPFTDDGKWAGRIVAAKEDEDSYLRGLSNERDFLYGVIDGQLTDNSTLTAGYSYQAAHSDGNMWGGLVLGYSDGSQAEFETDASTAQEWTYWDTFHKSAFVEYAYRLGDDWDLKLTYNNRQTEDDDALFFAFPLGGLDKATHLGILGWPGSWSETDDADLYDANLTGRFALFGREHDATVGASYSESEHHMYTRPFDPSESAAGLMPPFPYPGNATSEPDWGPTSYYSQSTMELTRYYGATRLSLLDRVDLFIGANAIEFRRDGDDQGVGYEQGENEISPYAGVTVDLTDDLLAYVSYSDIYQPQDQQGTTGEYLDPTKGVNYEIGLKAEWFEQRLLTTLALFTAEQENLATYAGINSDAQYYYTGEEVNSEGVEIEITGSISENLQVVLGVTSLKLEDGDGNNTYEWVPRETVNFAVTGKLPFQPDVSLGLNGRWQSKTEKLDEYTVVNIHQGDYFTLNGFARWDFTDNAWVGLNINNLTDEKYLTSLYQVGYYAAPLNGSVSVGYKF